MKDKNGKGEGRRLKDEKTGRRVSSCHSRANGNPFRPYIQSHNCVLKYRSPISFKIVTMTPCLIERATS